MLRISILVLLAALVLVNGTATVSKLGMCDPKGDYKIKFEAKLKNDGDKQIVEEASLTTDIDIGDNVKNNVEVAKFDSAANDYKFLTKIEVTYCEFMEKFMGEFSDAMMEAGGLKKGTCPIPKGAYKLTNHHLDFSLVKGKDEVPDGKFRVKNNLVDAKTNAPLGCMEIDFTLEK
ncbi:unnamed protein product [Brassicogethes aeneus]|uniref:MD-2-related lipid-recognition domain-containing protein n=1 Tax=Brassicogethes aeneus TaxID=1431903 RepID=A0A9P0B046_BRAAE|nr:unnamed protein product [Brassicogethes aeneus]